MSRNGLLESGSDSDERIVPCLMEAESSDESDSETVEVILAPGSLNTSEQQSLIGASPGRTAAAQGTQDPCGLPSTIMLANSSEEKSMPPTLSSMQDDPEWPRLDPSCSSMSAMAPATASKRRTWQRFRDEQQQHTGKGSQQQIGKTALTDHIRTTTSGGTHQAFGFLPGESPGHLDYLKLQLCTKL